MQWNQHIPPVSHRYYDSPFFFHTEEAQGSSPCAPTIESHKNRGFRRGILLYSEDSVLGLLPGEHNLYARVRPPSARAVTLIPNTFLRLKGSLVRQRIFCLFFACLCISSTLFGQATTSLRGTITDQQGAVIAAAVVTLTDASTGANRKVVSDKSGEYQFLQVAPGKYTVQVEMPGFDKLTKSGLVLEVNTPATLDCKLQIGSVGTVVAVEADAATINTVDASVGNAFTQTQVRELPLQTRNVVELLSIQPGVTQTGEVLGARRDQNNITLDGVDVNQNQNSGISMAGTNGQEGAGTTSGTITPGFNAALPVPLDSVQEFRVTVGGQGANQGRSSGGQVTLITKSGTNQFHGSFYEYNRNTDLTSNDWFNNRSGVARTPLVRNQFGASLGGPVIKNRVFFFGNWERRIDASGQSALRTVPSETLKQGVLQVKLTNGTTQQLGPSDILALDPLHLGFSSAMKSYLNAYPVGNNPAAGADHGLNFSGLLFNAPFQEDDSAYVAKMDFNLDQARKHTLSVRGTLAGDAQTNPNGISQFPGQSAASQILNNSRGLSALYTWVARPTLINTFSYGLTRYSVAQSGTLGTSISFQSLSSPINYSSSVRPNTHLIPTHNVADDLNWTKGKHTITTGINFRFITNDLTSYSNSFASYSFSRNTLGGLGGDATTFVTNYLAQKLGDPSVKLADPTNVQGALGDLLGLINQYSITYNFGRTGASVPIGNPVVRNFATNEYEGYVQDSWRVRRDLTLTLGLRYSSFSVPQETNGVQVGTTVGLDKYFAERVGAMLTGTPNNQLPDASLTYALNGPANGKSSWYGRDKNNFGPRFAFAYSPDDKGDHFWNKWLGKGSVIRGGFAMVYDRYGSDLITYIDSTGSPGLATSLTQPVNTNFTTSARYPTLPTLPAASGGTFPYTPATITGGFNQGVGVDPNLVAPYSFVLNLNYARELPGKLTMEVGYAGRLSRKNLIQQDFDQPLTQFKDPTSGQTWVQGAGALRTLYDAGLTPAQVRANPGLVPAVPFIENMFPTLKNAYFNGSASANYFDVVYNQNAGSDLDALNQMDRQRKSDGSCYTKTGCNTFYPLQLAGLPTWTNAGFSDYHAGTLTIRRPLSNGIGFDFNYTLSHSIDNSSGAESGASTSGGVLQDAFNPSAFRGSSDFDARHNITTDVLLQLPFGKGHKFAGNAPLWLDEFIGGWQLALIGRYHSGLPTALTYGGVYNVNYENSSIAIAKPGYTPRTSIGIDSSGVPSLFASTSAANNFEASYPGVTGTRAIIRLPGYTNFDMSLSKSFKMPWEGHALQFRAEAFNAFNNVNFYAPGTSVSSPGTFGEFQKAQPMRVMQLSLRYQF